MRAKELIKFLEQHPEEKGAMIQDVTLQRMLHRVDECPKSRHIYVFFKHKGHDVLSVDLYRFPTGDVIVGDIDFGIENAMPVAWCYAADLMKALGYTNAFAHHAKDYTKFSYKGEEVI